MSDKQAAAALREYLENREMPATVYVAICVAIRKLEEPMDGGADDIENMAAILYGLEVLEVYSHGE